MWQLPKLDNIWNYTSTDSSEVQIRTQLDPTATVVISSSTAKTVTIFDAVNGLPLVKCCPGEITTAMCISTNAKQLITASDKGVIYIWRLPAELTQKLIDAKTKPKVAVDPKKELVDVLGKISNVTNLLNNMKQPEESQNLPQWAQNKTPSTVKTDSETKEVRRVTEILTDFKKQESINDPPVCDANQPALQTGELEDKPKQPERFIGYFNPLADSSSEDEDSEVILNNRQQ